ncbi:MAG: amino acid ABC transporter permease, partial [Bombilactobacillus mellis]|nr:amino acid ABC transporter permease [Bombilactobacillus mellis]
MQNWIHAYSLINLRFLLMGLGVTVYISVISVVLSFIFG